MEFWCLEKIRFAGSSRIQQNPAESSRIQLNPAESPLWRTALPCMPCCSLSGRTNLFLFSPQIVTCSAEEVLFCPPVQSKTEQTTRFRQLPIGMPPPPFSMLKLLFTEQAQTRLKLVQNWTGGRGGNACTHREHDCRVSCREFCFVAHCTMRRNFRLACLFFFAADQSRAGKGRSKKKLLHQKS